MTQPQIESAAPAPALPEAAAPTQAETNAGVARASGVLALGNVASRVLGLVRETVLANQFGASASVDAFNIALIIPRTIHDLLIAGHVNSAIVPVLSEVAATSGTKAFWQLVTALLTLVTVLMIGLVLLLQAFAPALVAILGGGSAPETQQLAVDLLRLTSPALLFLALFSLASGTLYALRAFTLPAFAAAVFNGAVVLTMLALAPTLGIHAAAVGWLVGALAQLLLQLPGLRLPRLRPSLAWSHPGVRRIARLYAPVMLSLILDTVIRAFSYNIASGTGSGNIGIMNWATTLIQFPHGLVGTAISIAVLPTLSRQAALVAEQGAQAFKDTLGMGLRLVIVLILPATVGLFVMAHPIIGLLFEHGQFTPADTAVAAQALRYYLVGLPFAALDLLLIYAFYARQDTRTPAVIGLVSLLVYLAATLLLLPVLGLYSLMVADSVKHIVHASLSAFVLQRRLGGMGGQRLLLTLGQTGLAALTMGLVIAWLDPLLERWLGSGSLLRELAVVLGGGGVSVVVFAACAYVLRIGELRWLLDILRARLRGG